MRPTAGQAQGPAGEEPAAQPRRATVFGGGRPLEREAPTPLPEPSQADGQPCDGGFPAGGLGPESGDLGGSIARPRWVDGGEFVAQGRDEVPL